MGFTGRREVRKIIDLFFLSSRLPVQFRPLPTLALTGSSKRVTAPGRVG
jgi:hypothetical protein